MLTQQQKLVLSPYMDLYEKLIPKDNRLRRMKELIDFKFIYEELENKYCLNNGRNAVSPVIMFKYLLMKIIFTWSDVDVVEHSRYDLSMKFFLDIAPEDEVIEASSLTKFRKLIELFFKWIKQNLKIKKFLGKKRKCSKNTDMYNNYCIYTIEINAKFERIL